MATLLNQIATAAGAGQVGPVYQIRGGPGSAQLHDVIFLQANFTYGSGGTKRECLATNLALMVSSRGATLSRSPSRSLARRGSASLKDRHGVETLEISHEDLAEGRATDNKHPAN
jgi:hypothetical protein